MDGSLRRFCDIADAIRSTTSKLEKTRLLAEFLRESADGDLYWAAVYFRAAPFREGPGA